MFVRSTVTLAFESALASAEPSMRVSASCSSTSSPVAASATTPSVDCVRRTAPDSTETVLAFFTELSTVAPNALKRPAVRASTRTSASPVLFASAVIESPAKSDTFLPTDTSAERSTVFINFMPPPAIAP